MAASMGRAIVGQGQAEALLCLRFDVGGGQVLGLDDDRRAAGIGDEQVGLQAGAVPAMTRVFSNMHARCRAAWAAAGLPKALLAFGSVWRGMGAALSSSLRGSRRAAAQGNIRSREPGAAAG